MIGNILSMYTTDLSRFKFPEKVTYQSLDLKVFNISPTSTSSPFILEFQKKNPSNLQKV